MYNYTRQQHDTIVYRQEIMKQIQHIYNPLKGYKKSDIKIDYMREFVDKSGNTTLVLYPFKKCYAKKIFAPWVWHFISSDMLNRLTHMSYFECSSYIRRVYESCETDVIRLSSLAFDTQFAIREYVNKKDIKHCEYLGLFN